MTIPVDFNLIAAEYNAANKRLILLDYDGTLVPFANDPASAKPDLRIKTILSALSRDKRNEVVVISGRTRQDLDCFFGEAGLTLVAEHGGYFKRPFEQWQQTFDVHSQWITDAAKAIKALTFEHEGSRYEEKAYSVVWHYRSIASSLSDHDHGKIIDALCHLPDHGKFIVEDSQFTIELRTPSIDKGAFLEAWCKQDFSFKLAIGDGRTDEDLFRTLGKSHFTIKVGPSVGSEARFHLNSQQEVQPFLTKILLVNDEFERMKHIAGLDQEDFNSI